MKCGNEAVMVLAIVVELVAMVDKDDDGIM